jgi:hypothetical protein
MMSDAPQISQPAVITYQEIADQFDFLKKYQWSTTNYLVLIYGGIAWFGQHFTLARWQIWALSGVTILAACIGIGLLVRFQCDLGNIRVRAAKANNELLPEHERSALGLKYPDPNPYTRGWEVLVALILVSLVGALLAVMSLTSESR